MNGFSGCLLSIEPGLVSLHIEGAVTRLLHHGMVGISLRHERSAVALVHVRYDLPWRRSVLLLYAAERRVLVPLSRPRARVITTDLRAAGVQVEEYSVTHFGDAVTLLDSLRVRNR